MEQWGIITSYRLLYRDDVNVADNIDDSCILLLSTVTFSAVSSISRSQASFLAGDSTTGEDVDVLQYLTAEQPVSVFLEFVH